MPSRLTIARHAALYLSTDESVHRHATQAWKLVVAIDGALDVVTERRRFSTRAVLVPPYLEQAMGGSGTRVAFFAEPGSKLAPYSRLDAIAIPDARTCEALVRIAHDVALGRAADDLDRVAAAYRETIRDAPSRVDRRVARALEALSIDSSASIDEVAAAERVSETRLRHVVHASTGLSLRTHRLWHRTLDAVERMMAGRPIARAAHEAGFADHAHFTRSFRRFFGRTPSSMNAPACIVDSYAPRLATRARSANGD